jgi:alpha-N-arabinofuranosidase
MACMAPVVNARGPLFVHPRGVVKRTTFHVLKMYSDLLQPNVIEGHVTSDELHVDQSTVPALDAVATCSDDRKQFAIAFINRHPELPARWKVDFNKGTVLQRVRLTTLVGDSTDACNDVAHPNRVVPEKHELPLGIGTLELPPHSVSILEASI